MPYKIAIASSDGKVVNQHFGRADRFHIVQVDEHNEYQLVEIRNRPPICQGGNHDEVSLEENANALSDCSYVIVSRIGAVAENVLNQRGIAVYTIPDLIDEAITRLISYIQIDELMNSFGK